MPPGAIWQDLILGGACPITMATPQPIMSTWAEQGALAPPGGQASSCSVRSLGLSDSSIVGVSVRVNWESVSPSGELIDEGRPYP